MFNKGDRIIWRNHKGAGTPYETYSEKNGVFIRFINHSDKYRQTHKRARALVHFDGNKTDSIVPVIELSLDQNNSATST